MKKTLTDLNLLNKLEQIYNVEETSLPLDPSKLKVITVKCVSDY